MLTLLVALMLVPAPPQARGRLRPPLGVTLCDRNQLTAHSGKVTAWSRDDSAAHLSMDTDADTKENFTIRFEKGTLIEKWFLIGGETMRTDDWKKVEVSRGRLRTGMEATVWICQGAANPIIDWRPPPQ